LKKLVIFILFFTFKVDVFACEVTRAAFDIGSGSMKLKVYKFNTCKNKIVKQVKSIEKKSCEESKKVSYKEDLKNSPNISFKTLQLGIEAIKELKNIAEKCGAKNFSGVATSAFRQAENGESAIKLLSTTGVDIRIISQEEEAQIGFLGALYKSGKEDNKDICVWDIGGSSMQITCRKDKKEKVFLGNLASIPFKNLLLTIQNKKSKSPNPISKNDYIFSQTRLKKEAQEIKKRLGSFFDGKIVLGIGGVHNYAIAKEIGDNEYSQKTLYSNILKDLNKNDRELGGGKYVDTSLSNKILVEGLINYLKIKKVRAVKVNLTEGLIMSKKYWN
jgi:exopolyphosphatase/guanosine-5'-triphosphate,3'-diphosphate pyrophosphatase